MATFFVRFVSILFLIFEKVDKAKIGLGFFKISNYISFNIWERNKQKIGQGFLTFVSIVFLNILKDE